MQSIKRVSDITVQDMVDFCRIDDPDESDQNMLSTALNVAISYVQSYTGLDDLDPYPDIVIAVLVLVQDMYDTRTMYVDKSNVNKVVESILGLHQVNLL